MAHLDRETLARLIDEPPDRDERRHLVACPRCRDELEALRRQTAGLAHLPDPRPPEGEWERLEGRLREAGILGTARPWRTPTRTPAASSAAWLRIAASLLLLVTGASLGFGGAWILGTAPVPGAERSAASAPEGVPAVEGVTPEALAALDPDAPRARLTLEEAEALVRATERWYLAALAGYRESLGGSEEQRREEDVLARYAALESLLAAGRAAVREAPTDPFLNGLLVNMHAEREATLRALRTSTGADHWY